MSRIRVGFEAGSDEAVVDGATAAGSAVIDASAVESVATESETTASAAVGNGVGGREERREETCDRDEQQGGQLLALGLRRTIALAIHSMSAS